MWRLCPTSEIRKKIVEERTRPCLVIEIISPNYPGDDTHKVLIYEKAGIAEYIIIDPHSSAKKPYYELFGYRLKGKKYRPIKPDKQGRLLSETTQVWFSTANDKRELILTDASTGKRLLNNLKREADRQEAKRQAQEEAEARQEAEKRARKEAEARQEAERQRNEHEKKLKRDGKWRHRCKPYNSNYRHYNSPKNTANNLTVFNQC